MKCTAATHSEFQHCDVRLSLESETSAQKDGQATRAEVQSWLKQKTPSELIYEKSSGSVFWPVRAEIGGFILLMGRLPPGHRGAKQGPGATRVPRFCLGIRGHHLLVQKPGGHFCPPATN